jgi:hypothetical protein
VDIDELQNHGQYPSPVLAAQLNLPFDSRAELHFGFNLIPDRTGSDSTAGINQADILKLKGNSLYTIAVSFDFPVPARGQC